MAAAMQRLGVAQSDLLDPLRLMDLSANDPTELQNQIVQDRIMLADALTNIINNNESYSKIINFIIFNYSN